MRTLLPALVLIAGCTADDEVGTELPQPMDTVWANSIHAGDMFVLVPGTSSFDYIAATIDPMPDAVPEVSPRTMKLIADDALGSRTRSSRTARSRSVSGALASQARTRRSRTSALKAFACR
jgi:hypothetical protein